MVKNKKNDSKKLKKINTTNPDLNKAMVMACNCQCLCKTSYSDANATSGGQPAVSHFN